VVKKEYILHVHTAGGANRYILEVHTGGGANRYILHAHTACGTKRYILLVVKRYASCTSILLVGCKEIHPARPDCWWCKYTSCTFRWLNLKGKHTLHSP
jgi:hypothetical protein